MINILKKISVRKIKQEKGKSICVILALFLTTVMFVMIFSAVFFVKDALEELAKKNASWMADAAFIVDDEEYEAIRKSSLVSDLSVGFHIGDICDTEGFSDIELVNYEEKMAYWMKCYPTQGRMPQKDNEIVVSDKYLAERGIQFAENKSIEVTYLMDGIEYTDTFLLVGVYNRNIHSKHVMLLSNDFYEIIRERLEQLGKDSDAIMTRTVEVMFASSQNVRKLTYLLMEEIEFDFEKQGFTYNENSVSMDDVGVGAWLMLACLLLFVMLVGYLFISNIFQISIVQDTKFFGKLSTIGVTEKEIENIICRKNNILYLIASLPAIIVGYIFSGFVLPNLLNSFFAFQVERNDNIMIFIMSLFFSYITLWISERKAIRMAKKISPIEMRRFMGNYGKVKSADNKNCLKKMSIRDFGSDRKKALKIIVSIAISLLLAETFYTAVMGFDEKEYISQNLEADYTIAKKSFFTEISARNKENITDEELAECSELPGVIKAGGGAVCSVKLSVQDEIWEKYEKIVGEQNYNNDFGEMTTYTYGLDDVMVKKMQVKKGSLNLELYHTGDYVLIDALNDAGETCFQVGDSITIPFANGIEKTYTVMAVVELPFSLSYQDKWMASSNLFLPMSEWQKQTQKKEYYMYTYDIEKEYKNIWDDTLSSIVEVNETLLYKSAKTEMEAAEEYIKELKLVGFVLSVILVCMGVMNFTNCMAGSIYSRKKEFAILQGMGMHKVEIIKILSIEGILYMTSGLIIGLVITVPFVYVLFEKILIEPYLKYYFYPQIYLLFAVVGILVAIAVPWFIYMIMDRRESFLQRIRACKE